MAAKQLPIDIKVLRVFAHRYKWLLVILTFSSFAFSAFIVKSMVNLYSAATTIYVDPESVLGEVDDITPKFIGFQTELDVKLGRRGL